MGGNKGDRKSYKATSSAKAAEALAAKGAGTAGFGGFSGLRPVAGFGFGAPAAAAATVGSAAADPLELSAQLDGDFAQCLRHLSKRDTTTKMKALQNLRELIPQKSAADMALLLQPWGYQFKKLLLDPSKAVRSEAAGIMASVGAAVGKGLLPQLKGLLGPWYLACFDPYPDAAAAAKRSLVEVFPGKKQADAMMYCRSEVLAHITSCLSATPQSLGDPRKDTPEELEERFERITAASMAAAAALLSTLQQQAQQQPAEPSTAAAAAAAAAVEEVSGKLEEVLQAPGFFKKQLGSKSVVVRRAAYGLVRSLAGSAPQLLRGCQAAAAPAVLGALQEKEPSNHPAMWEMLLAFITSQQPDCWTHINMQKAFAPRLLALLRHACYGSAATSLPALLPLVTLLPRQLPGFQPLLLLDGVLEAVWAGLQQCAGNQAARAAIAAAYQEVLAWGLRDAGSSTQSGTAAAADGVDLAASSAGDAVGGVRAACEQLLLQGHFSSLLDFALGGSGADAQLAAGIVQELLLAQCSSSSTATAASSDNSEQQQQQLSSLEQPVQLQVLLQAIGAAAQKHLAAAATAHHAAVQDSVANTEAAAVATASGAVAVCSRMQQLFNALADAGSSAAHSQAAAGNLASCCCAALLPLLQAGQQLPAAASQLMARLIREYPSATAASQQSADAPASSRDSSITALVRMGLASCSNGSQISAADLELLLSCLAGASDSAAAWGAVLSIATADADASGSAVPGWRFLDALLRGFASSSNPAGAAEPGWSHTQLDAFVLQLTKQLRAAEVAAAVEWSSHKQQAAAASLLGCCLGANEQQQVLLSCSALETALTDVVTTLQAAQQLLQEGNANQDQQAVAEAAAVCVSALRMALASSGRAADRHSSSGSSPSSSSSIWMQQPGQLVQLLVLLAQLSWGGQEELQLPTGQFEEEDYNMLDDSASSDGSSSVGSSSSSSDDSSSDFSELAEDISSEADATAASAAAADASGSGTGKANGSGSGSDKSAWQVLQQAAARVWSADQLSCALDDLPSEQGQQLVSQLQQLLQQGLSQAAAAAASADAAGVAAAVEAGLRWGNRAAVVLSGLDGRQWQQQELVQQLLAAADAWQYWCCSKLKMQANLSSSSSSSNMCGGVDNAVQALMVTLSSVLVLQVGCSIMLPLQNSANHSKEGSTSSSSSTQWLLLELLCTATSLTGAANDTAAAQKQQQLLHCVPAAAAAAEQYLLRNAARGSSRSAAAAARTLLAETLALLLSAAQASSTSTSTAAAADCASSEGNGSVCKVYCSTLTALLQQAVELVAARPAAAQQLLPVLQAFCSEPMIAAASGYAQVSEASSSAAAAAANAPAPAWVLVQLLEVLSGAFRFANEECVTASGLSQLSVGFVNKALAVDPTAAQDSSSSSSSSTQNISLQLLQLAVACFPLQHSQGPGSHHHHHHTRQNQQQQATAGSSTAVERQALTALLRHACSTSSTAGSTAGYAAGTTELLCRLQLCCVCYCWQDMSAAEWHVVLRDCQARLSSTRREFERAGGSLAGAACAAAQQLTAALSSDSVMTPAVAIEMLRKLSNRGVLQKQAAVTGQLAAAAEQAVAGLSLPLLRLGLQLLAAVLQLQQQIQAAGRAPQLELALSSAWRELLLIVMALGGALAVGSSCGPAVSGVVMQCLDGQAAAWQLLSHCCPVGAEQQETVSSVLAAADERAEMLGVDAVSSCLALLQAPLLYHATGHTQQPTSAAAAAAAVDKHAVEPLQQMAWQLLLHPASLTSITHSAAAAASGAADELPEFGVNDDAAAFLIQVGLRPEMAAGIAATKPWQVQLLYWALLLAHIAQLTAPGSKTKSSVAAQRSLTQALRDVPELVPQLLDRLVGLMGLGGSSKAAAAAAAEQAAAEDGSSSGALAVAEPSAGAVAPGAGLSVAAQVQLSAKLQQLGTGSAAAALAGDSWELSAALRALDLPHTHSSWRLLAAALYRAVLQQLPASARLWFSDLRDRSRLTAVESYTTRFESPALLAAEFAAIRRDAGGASGEVGGSCSFKVRASPAAREVTAVLEIEDGATLELQVKLPAAAPLKAAEVECRNKVGIKDGRLRKWLLSIAVFLRNQNQGVLDAISLWKANLEQEFAGVEPCLVCMCVISTVNGQLPRLSCRHCHVSFHPACLYKWFRSSGKSNCVHCQNPW